MTKSKPEERYPLLLLYVEENGRKSEFPQRVVFADKGRGKEVTKGAAAILTQWPAQVTSCWLASVAFGTTFILISLVLLLSSLNTLIFPIHPRCTRDTHDQIGNKTIHLVKHGSVWSHKQLNILRLIADTYPEYEIRNIILDSSFKKFKKREKKKQVTSTTEQPHYHSLHMPDIANLFLKKLTEIAGHNDIETNIKEGNSTHRNKRHIILFKVPKSYEDILNTHANIREEKITYKQYFTTTPLHYFWPDYSTEMILFSVRVLELWQNGGITFHLPNYESHEHKKNTSTLIKTKDNKTHLALTASKETVNISHLKMVITNTKARYEKLTEDLVSIDEQGFHMSTKIPCHSFFGEMIIKLQKDVTNLTVPNFIEKILYVFCKRGAVDSEYCMKNHLFLS